MGSLCDHAGRGFWLRLLAPLSLGVQLQFSGCCTHRAVPCEPTAVDDLVQSRQLTPGFPTGNWQLGVFFRGEVGRPNQAFERLYAVGREGPVEIRSVRDLGNLRLPIRTPADARSFVLFVTDPTVYYLFSPPVGVTLTCSASAGRPALGTVTQGLFDRISAFLPEVCEPAAGVFVVTRCLLIPSLVLKGEEWGYPVLSVEEVVDQSGRYSVRTAHILGMAHRDELRARPAIDWGWWEFGRGLADRLVAEPHGYHLKLLTE